MIKCIVWDLDGTLWDGVLNEGAPLLLNENAGKAVKEADARGMIQSIASRNEAGPAMERLQYFGLSEYFLFPQIEPWLAKPDALKRIAEHFNIGIDTLAFVDDDPFERYEAERYLPEAAVFSADEIDLLMETLRGIAANSQSDEHGCADINGFNKRRVWMLAREKSLEAEAAFTGTRAEFLAECNITLTVRRAVDTDIPRVRELLSRARRLNTAPGRDVSALLSDNNTRLYVCELHDIFGDHGMVGASLIRTIEKTLCIEMFCVSCRVEGRGAAAAFLHEILRRETAGPEAQALSEVLCRSLGGMSHILFKSMGFAIAEAGKDGGALFRLPLPYNGTGVTWITTSNAE